MALALLKGSARDKFQQMLREHDTENTARPARQRKTQDEHFQMVMNQVGKSYFPILHAYQKQVDVQHYVRLGDHTVRNFPTCLRKLNNYLPYFPREEGKVKPTKLSDDNLIQILNQAKPEEWQLVILCANIELHKFNFQGTVESAKYKKCAHCGCTNHASKDCWFSPENKGKPKPGKKNVSATDKNVLMTQEQRNAILERLLQHPESGKRKVSDFTPEDSDAEKLQMFSPKTTTSTPVNAKDNSDSISIYFELLSSDKITKPPKLWAK
jgi:hypothetical protein